MITRRSDRPGGRHDRRETTNQLAKRQGLCSSALGKTPAAAGATRPLQPQISRKHLRERHSLNDWRRTPDWTGRTALRACGRRVGKPTSPPPQPFGEPTTRQTPARRSVCDRSAPVSPRLGQGAAWRLPWPNESLAFDAVALRCRLHGCKSGFLHRCAMTAGSHKRSRQVALRRTSHQNARYGSQWHTAAAPAAGAH